MKVIVADSSTLITLLDTHNFDLLFGLFGQLIITREVYKEITFSGDHQVIIDEHIQQHKISLQTIEYDELYEMLIKRLDRGESESIVLAKRSKLALLIDERKGRSIAKSLDISVIGLIGIILKLMETKIITKAKAIKIVKQVEENNFRLSSALKYLIYDY